MKIKNTSGIVLAVIITAAVFVVGGEVARSHNRSQAVSYLNMEYPKLKTNAEKQALLVKTNTIVATNRSWFSFSNSSANQASDDASYGDGCEPGSTNWICNLRNDPDPTGNVTTDESWDSVWVWQDPTTGEWHDGGR